MMVSSTSLYEQRVISNNNNEETNHHYVIYECSSQSPEEQPGTCINQTVPFTFDVYAKSFAPTKLHAPLKGSKASAYTHKRDGRRRRGRKHNDIDPLQVVATLRNMLWHYYEIKKAELGEIQSGLRLSIHESIQNEDLKGKDMVVGVTKGTTLPDESPIRLVDHDKSTINVKSPRRRGRGKKKETPQKGMLASVSSLSSRTTTTSLSPCIERLDAKTCVSYTTVFGIGGRDSLKRRIKGIFNKATSESVSTLFSNKLSPILTEVSESDNFEENVEDIATLLVESVLESTILPPFVTLFSLSLQVLGNGQEGRVDVRRVVLLKIQRTYEELVRDKGKRAELRSLAVFIWLLIEEGHLSLTVPLAIMCSHARNIPESTRKGETMDIYLVLSFFEGANVVINRLKSKDYRKSCDILSKVYAALVNYFNREDISSYSTAASILDINRYMTLLEVQMDHISKC